MFRSKSAYDSSWTWHVLSVTLLVVFAALFQSADFLKILSLDRSLGQLVLMPLLAVYLWRWRILGTASSRAAIILACVVALGIAIYTHLPQRLSRPALLIARFQDDEFETKSRIFREELQRRFKEALGARRASVLARHVQINSPEAAQEQLTHQPNLLGIIYGNTRWLNVSLNSDRVSPFSASIAPWLRHANLKLVDGLERFGIGYSPQAQTQEFLAELFAGLTLNNLPVSVLDDRVFAETELNLKQAGSIAGAWRANEHRAVPYFFLGNFYLARAFSEQGADLGEARCAEDAYNRARRYLSMTREQVWLASILNNRGVLRYLWGDLTRDSELKKKSLRDFVQASKLVHLEKRAGQRIRGARVARRNLEALKAGPRKKRRTRQAKNKAMTQEIDLSKPKKSTRRKMHHDQQ